MSIIVISAQEKLRELAHEKLYEQAIRFSGIDTAPNWCDLTEEQRVAIRRVNEEHLAWMDKMGKAISEGTVPPDPFLIGSDE